MSKENGKQVNGVYTIRCRYNNRICVGSAINVIAKRWSKYISELKRGIYYNQDLQKDWNEYGISAFEFTIVEECTEDRRKREKYWKDYYESIGFELYNKNDIKDFEIKKHTKEEQEEIHKNMSEAQKETNNPRCRLSKEEIFNILDLRAEGVPLKEIATKYDIKPNYIYRIGYDRRMGTYKEWLNKNEKVTIPASIITPSATAIAHIYIS